jgi:hypothetical protein
VAFRTGMYIYWSNKKLNKTKTKLNNEKQQNKTKQVKTTKRRKKARIQRQVSFFTKLYGLPLINFSM